MLPCCRLSFLLFMDKLFRFSINPGALSIDFHFHHLGTSFFKVFECSFQQQVVVVLIFKSMPSFKVKEKR